MELNETEAHALVVELRLYAEMREDMFGDLGETLQELQAELANDSTYAYDTQATDAALDQAARRHEQAQQQARGIASPYFDLANQVAQTHHLDLNDPETRQLVSEVVDNTGWEVGRDAFHEPPAEMRQVVQGIQTRRLMNTSFGVEAARATQAPATTTPKARTTASNHTRQGTGIGD